MKVLSPPAPALAPAFALALFAGCSGGTIQSTDGGGPVPGPDGRFAEPLFNENLGFEITADGGGFGYRTGQREAGGPFVGEAGVIPGTEVGRPPAGSVTYAGRFEVAAVALSAGPNDMTTELNRQISGPITLVADFTHGSLTGAGGPLTVAGTITNRAAAGEVTFEGIAGALSGIAGRDRVVDAFAGEGPAPVYAGEFLAEN